MKHSTSVHNFRATAAKTREITKNIAIKASDFSTYLSLFLANSRGKDKMLSLFQYTFEFFCTCARHSNIPHHQKAFMQFQFLDMIIYENLKEDISSARKVFRLFRSFDEIKGCTKVIRTDKPLLYKLLSVFTYVCSCCYYLCDNSLWLVGILIKSKAVQKGIQKAFKRKKNMFSLYRVIAYLIILIYSVILQTNQIKEQEYRLKTNSECELLGNTKLIYGRRKNRFLKFEIWISLLRFVMLTSSLKLKGYRYLDPIFVASCGVTSSILNFLKTIYEKKIIINFEKTVFPSAKKIESTPAKDW